MSPNAALKVFGVLCVLLFAGCSTAPKDTTGDTSVGDTSVDTAASSETGSEVESSTYGASAGTTASGSVEVNPDAELLKKKIVYFDFDKSVIRPEAYAVLKAHAKRLSADGSLTIRLEGHADERGTREYNLALGERRGNEVAKFLRLNGVSSSQMDIVSYGEEKPVSYGQNESSWAKNRRVEITY